MFWQICLNLEKWRFRLLPGQTEVNLLCAKKLYSQWNSFNKKRKKSKKNIFLISVHDMKKFGTSADDDETAAASEMYCKLTNFINFDLKVIIYCTFFNLKYVRTAAYGWMGFATNIHYYL